MNTTIPRTNIELWSQKSKTLDIRRYLRSMGFVVLTTPTTVEQLTWELRQQYSTRDDLSMMNIHRKNRTQSLHDIFLEVYRNYDPDDYPRLRQR